MAKKQASKKLTTEQKAALSTYKAVNALLANMYDCGDAESQADGDDGAIRKDVSDCEKALCLLDKTFKLGMAGKL